MATDYAILSSMRRFFRFFLPLCLAVGLAVSVSACGDDSSSSAEDLSSSSEEVESAGDAGSSSSKTPDCKFDVNAKFWEYEYKDAQGTFNIVHYRDQDSVLFVEHFVSTDDNEEQCGILSKAFADMYYIYSDSLCFNRLDFSFYKQNEDGTFGPFNMSKGEYMEAFVQNCLADGGNCRNPEKPFGNTPGYDPEFIEEYFGHFTE